MTLKRSPKVAHPDFNGCPWRQPKASGPSAPVRRFSARYPGKVLLMFTPQPPSDPHHALSILRCSPRGYLDAVLVCDQYTGVMTHWWDDHTVLHASSGPCEPCSGGQSPRWQGFIIVESVESGQFRLLQFTPPVARVFNSHREHDGRLSGVVARLHREGRERNSPLFAKLVGYRDDRNVFSSEQLDAAVAKLFRSSFPLFDQAASGIGRLPA